MAKAKEAWWVPVYRRRKKEFGPEKTDQLAMYFDNLARCFREDNGTASVVEMRRIEKALNVINEALESAFGRGETMTGYIESCLPEPPSHLD